MSRWFYSWEARLPSKPDEETWSVGIHREKFQLLYSQNDTISLARLVCVGQTLEDTRVIVEGWSRPGKDDCFVYIGRPTRDYRRPTIETPAPPGMLFVVFVLPDGTIDYWRWRQQSEADPEVPQGIEGKILWRRQKAT
jgi:hypothetical protein